MEANYDGRILKNRNERIALRVPKEKKEYYLQDMKLRNFTTLNDYMNARLENGDFEDTSYLIIKRAVQEQFQTFKEELFEQFSEIFKEKDNDG